MGDNKTIRSLSSLPAELLEKLARYLPTTDLNTLMETSHLLRRASIDVWVQRVNRKIINFRPNKFKIEAEGIKKMFKIHRFANIRKMDLSRMNMNILSWEDVLKCIPKSKVEVLDVSKNKLTDVSGHLLAKAVSRVRVANLDGTHLVSNQLLHILESSNSSKTLQELNLRYNDLSELPENLVAKVVSRLKSVNLAYTDLTNEHIVEMLECCLESTTLESLNLCENDVMDVSPKLLARVVSKLQSVNLDATCLIPDQIVEILQTIRTSSKLENLNIRFNDLSSVPCPLIAEAVSNIKKVNVSFSDLGSEQVEEILTKSLDSNVLENLDLGGVELSEIPGELLAKATSRLKIANLGFSDLTPKQITQILGTALQSSTIQKIDLGGTDLDEVSTDLLDKAEHLIFLSNFLCVMIRERSQILPVC